MFLTVFRITYRFRYSNQFRWQRLDIFQLQCLFPTIHHHHSSSSSSPPLPVSYGEQDVLLVLIDSTRIRHRISVFDHRHTLTSKQRLIDTQCRRIDRGDTNISWDFVSHSHFDNVTWNQLACFDALDLSWSVLSNDFGDLRLVLFQRFDGTFSISFLEQTQTIIPSERVGHGALTCHTPTAALAMRMRRMTSGSTKAATRLSSSLCSSNRANTYEIQTDRIIWNRKRTEHLRMRCKQQQVESWQEAHRTVLESVSKVVCLLRPVVLQGGRKDEMRNEQRQCMSVLPLGPYLSRSRLTRSSERPFVSSTL